MATPATQNDLLLSQLDKVLKNSDLPKTEISEFVKMATASMQCDTACQKRKELEKLKQKWTSAKTEYTNLPKNISKYEKAYFDAAESPEFYNNNILREKYNEEADKFATQERGKLNKINRIATVLYESYDGETIALTRLQQLHDDLLNKNTSLKIDIDNNYKNTLTDERRVFYEIGTVDNLKYYNTILKYIYFILLGLYIIFGSFFSKQHYKKITTWVFIAIYIVVPFILKPIVDYFYN